MTGTSCASSKGRWSCAWSGCQASTPASHGARGCCSTSPLQTARRHTASATVQAATRTARQARRVPAGRSRSGHPHGAVRSRPSSRSTPPPWLPACSCPSSATRRSPCGCRSSATGWTLSRRCAPPTSAWRSAWWWSWWTGSAGVTTRSTCSWGTAPTWWAPCATCCASCARAWTRTSTGTRAASCACTASQRRRWWTSWRPCSGTRTPWWRPPCCWTPPSRC
mmetsp:Transcript_16309/g.40592  ORF Transcript_16309/g.40592 Transcript_16309/m.40592 type:complete len:223 (+) Transcript_16309:2650-3318(+)